MFTANIAGEKEIMNESNNQFAVFLPNSSCIGLIVLWLAVAASYLMMSLQSITFADRKSSFVTSMRASHCIGTVASAASPTSTRQADAVLSPQ